MGIGAEKGLPDPIIGYVMGGLLTGMSMVCGAGNEVLSTSQLTVFPFPSEGGLLWVE